MDPALFRCAIVGSQRIGDIKEALAGLIEAYLKVGCAAQAKVRRAPFNVKPPVGRSTCGRGENAAPAAENRTVRLCIGAEVALIRQNNPLQNRIGQGTCSALITGIAHKLQIAIGADKPAGIGGPVKTDREWKQNTRGAIIAMVASVGNPRLD